jgi:hypothetical protein
MSQQGLRRRVQEDCERGEGDATVVLKADLRALLAAHAKARRELALIRRLARMSGVDKHWWKMGGVTL